MGARQLGNSVHQNVFGHSILKNNIAVVAYIGSQMQGMRSPRRECAAPVVILTGPEMMALALPSNRPRNVFSSCLAMPCTHRECGGGRLPLFGMRQDVVW